MTTPYDDIINLPHHVSENHPPMARIARAVQFAPFAALTGYEEAVEETARLTQQKVELDENMKAELDERLRAVSEHLAQRPEITITYFKPDERKSGGAYVNITGAVKKLDPTERLVIMANGTKIPIDDILQITPPQIS